MQGLDPKEEAPDCEDGLPATEAPDCGKELSHREGSAPKKEKPAPKGSKALNAGRPKGAVVLAALSLLVVLGSTATLLFGAPVENAFEDALFGETAAEDSGYGWSAGDPGEDAALESNTETDENASGLGQATAGDASASTDDGAASGVSTGQGENSSAGSESASNESRSSSHETTGDGTAAQGQKSSSQSPGGKTGSTSARQGAEGSSAADKDASASAASRPGNHGGGNTSSNKQSDTMSVAVAVDSSAVGSPVSGSASAKLAQSATPYDALKACNLRVDAERGQFGMYVRAIGGLAEKQHGGGSGWTYAVNGKPIMVACDRYELKDGDRVKWTYVTG